MLSNLQLRFEAWGKACGFKDEGTTANPLVIPEDLIPHIEENLNCIEHLFADGATLKSRYGLRVEQKDPRTEGTHIRGRKSLSGILDRIKKKYQGDVGITASGRWAIEDKEKFEKLINDLKDFIEALEFFTKDLGVSQNQRTIVQNEVEEISDISNLEEIAAARTGEGDIVSDVATVRLSTIGSSHGRGTTTESYHTARAWAETELPPVDESQSQLQDDVPQNRRLMLGLAKPKTESFDASKNTFLTDVTIVNNYNQILNIWKRPMLKQFKRRPLQHIRSSTLPFDEIRSFAVAPINGNVEDLLVTFVGPYDTPFQEGVFFLRMKIPSDFPFEPPICQFLTRIYHPNVDPSGAICLDILAEHWTPILGLEKTILSVISILSDPGLEDPLVPEIAVLYMTDRDQYSENARAYTEKYASPNLVPSFSADGTCEMRELPEYSLDQMSLARLLRQNFAASYKLYPFREPWFLFRDRRKRFQVRRKDKLNHAVMALDLALYELCDLHKPWDFQKAIGHLENSLKEMKYLLEAGFSPNESVDAPMRALVDSCQQKVAAEAAHLQALVDRME